MYDMSSILFEFFIKIDVISGISHLNKYNLCDLMGEHVMKILITRAKRSVSLVNHQSNKEMLINYHHFI